MENAITYKIFLFGELRVEQNGLSMPLLPYRCQDLFVYLLLNHHRFIGRERISGELFPDYSSRQARARLSDYLWLIGSTFPELEIKRSKDEIQISKHNIWFDFQEFSNLIQHDDIDSLSRSIRLYTGDIVPDLYSDWVILFREQYRNQYINCLRKLANHYQEVGAFSKVCDTLDLLLLKEPFDESAIRQLMHTHVRLGRRGIAVSIFEKYCLFCQEQLNVQPEEATLILFEAISARTNIPNMMSESLKSQNSNPSIVLKKATQALYEGKRDELFTLLRSLSNVTDEDIAFQRDLLFVDQSIQWGEFSQAWQYLERIKVEDAAVDLRRATIFLYQNNLLKAEPILKKAIKISVIAQNKKLEAIALLLISKLKLKCAEFQDSMLAVNRSIHIATMLDQPFIIIQGYIQKGRINFKQGTHHDARDILLQAQSLAQIHNFKCLLVEINMFIANSFRRNGFYLNAYRISNTALELARDTGLRNFEAHILLDMAATSDFLGRKTESIQSLETARSIFGEFNDLFGLAKVDYNLAAALPYHDESRCKEAILYAQSALNYFLNAGQKEWQAVAYTSLAFALWLMGDHREAINNYKISLNLHQSLGEHGFIPELCAYIGLAYLGCGNIKKALSWTDRALQEQAMLNLSDIVSDIFFARAQALDAAGKTKKAVKFYKQAYQTLLDYAKDIDDEVSRQAFFNRDPITRRLMKKVFELGLAVKEEKISFKNKMAGKNNQLHEITLTVHAGPSDLALAQQRGHAVMRRAQLRRILQQIESKNIKLSVAELAKALKVSVRTIQRDLAVLNSLSDNFS